MRILVLSDAHENINYIKKAIECETTAKKVFYLGDGASDILRLKENYPDKEFVILKGNNDVGAFLEIYSGFLNGLKTIALHGHKQYVKYNLDRLYFLALENEAKIVLYGHTHNPDITFNNGIYFLNPGALFGIKPTYMVIDFEKSGIMPIIKALKLWTNCKFFQWLLKIENVETTRNCDK